MRKEVCGGNMTQTEFDTERVLLQRPGSLFVGNGKYIKIIELLLSVKIESADGGVLLSGTSLFRSQAKAVFSSIDYFLGKDEEIDEQIVRYLCTLSLENRLDGFEKAIKDVILVTPKGKSIRAKTLGQHVYIDTQRH